MTKDEALEQPANLKLVEDNGNGIKTYEILPTNQWQGLTDDEMHEVIIKHVSVDCRCDPYEFVRAIEAKLKEKNTPQGVTIKHTLKGVIIIQWVQFVSLNENIGRIIGRKVIYVTEQ